MKSINGNVDYYNEDEEIYEDGIFTDETDDEPEETEKDELVINQISANGKAEIVLTTLNKQISDDVVYAIISTKVEDSSNNIYRSNLLKEKVVGARLEVTLDKQVTTDLLNDLVKPGDKIKYTIKIKNTGYLDIKSLDIVDYFSKYLKLNSLKLNGNTCEYRPEPMIGREYINHILNINTSLKSKDEIILEIDGEVDDSLPDEEILKVTNKAIIYGDGVTLFETEETSNIIEQEAEEDEEPENPDEPENPEDKEDESGESDSKNNKYSISGIAWLDENENGKRDDNEKVLNDLTAILLNIENNANRSVKIGEDGKYVFNDIENGRYVILFEYDTGKYVLTSYNANGVDSNINSDFGDVTMTVNGVNKKVASTDILTIKDNGYTNIDIGLKKLIKFDLELEKTITKITVKNKEGTKVYNYKNVNLAKAEIRAKYIEGSTVKIEYSIKVKNNGDIPGYARKIVDYKPNDLEFDSNENSKWKETENYLYTNALENTIINPGETKEITLVLTKKMTNSNTGLTNNMAEILEDYNAQGISDIDSKPNNKEGKEDDLGQANAIISVSTGKTVSYVIITLIITIGIAILAYINLKKLLYKKLNI